MSRTRAVEADSQRSGRPRAKGFTLIEIMVVVVILGVLAAVAIPAFIKYIRRAKTAEAYDKISLLFRGSVAYVANSNEDVLRGTAGTGVTLSFPVSGGPSPAATCCTYPGDMCIPLEENWRDSPWRELDFQIDDPHWFVYSYISDTAGGVGSIFTARANGDLDCDGTMSTFERNGILIAPGGVRTSRGVYTRLAGE